MVHSPEYERSISETTTSREKQNHFVESYLSDDCLMSWLLNGNGRWLRLQTIVTGSMNRSRPRFFCGLVLGAAAALMILKKERKKK